MASRTDSVTSVQLREIRAGKRSLPPRPLTPAARKVAEATRATFDGSKRGHASDRAGVVEVELPIRIESTLNLAEHWRKRHRRAVAQDEAVTYSLIGSRDLRALVAAGGPYVVTITRIAPRVLDDDNAIGGAKNVRDSLARLLGIDDGNAAISWRYAQERRPKTYATRIRIEVRHAD